MEKTGKGRCPPHAGALRGQLHRQQVWGGWWPAGRRRGAGGKGPPSWTQKPKLHSKCAHASQRREAGEPPHHALPASQAWLVPPAGRAEPVRPGLGWTGAPGGLSAACPPLSFPALWVAGAWGRSAQDPGVGGGVSGPRGRVWGEGEAASVAPLQGALAAEDNLQVLAVELPRLSQGHDALSVVGELLDVHLLGDTERG